MHIDELSKQSEGRTKKSIRNISFGLIGQLIALIVTFVSRKIFVLYLSAEYLGLNGLFSNILSMLSLAELGIGTAIVFSLYKPLAKNNTEEIKSLMALFKKTYTIIGIFVFIVGASLTPFLSFFVSEMPDLPNIHLIYLMYVINSSASYFYTYKRSLIIADQNRYIASTYRYGLFFFQNVVQIFVLVIFKNYLAYLLIQIVCTLLENILLTHTANKMYPYLTDKNIQALPQKTTRTIRKNVTAMFCHKLGSIVVNGTDSVLISKLVDVASVGLYSNYLLTTTALHTVYGILFESITASFGNLNVDSSEEHKQNTFYHIFFGNACIYGWSTVCLLCLFNPFVRIWLGESYLLTNNIIYWIVAVFYVTGMRQAVSVARGSMGIYWNDRFKPIAESIINLVVSIILGKKLGISGIVIGTFVSSITTNFWVEPYILYKHGFHTSCRPYFVKYAKNTLVTAVTTALMWYLCSLLPDGGILNFALKAIVCALGSGLCFLVAYCRSEELGFFIRLASELIHKKTAR